MSAINQLKIDPLRRVALSILLAALVTACSGEYAQAGTTYNIPSDWTMFQSRGVTSFKAPKGVEGFSVVKSNKHGRRASEIITRLLQMLDKAGTPYRLVDRRQDDAGKLADAEIERDLGFAVGLVRHRYFVSVGDSGTVITDFWAPAGRFASEIQQIQPGERDPSMHAVGVARHASPAREPAVEVSNLHPIHVVRLHTMQSPDGGFTIGVPQGDWHVSASPVSADMPFATKIAIEGRDGTTVFLFLLLPVDDIASNIAQSQLPCRAQQGSLFYDPAECGLQMAMVGAKVASHQWSGTDAANLLGQVIQEMGGSVRSFSTRSQTENRAGFVLDYDSSQEGSVDTIGSITNFSFINTAVSEWAGQPEYWNFAFVSGCKAPAGRLGVSERNECATILNSFRPRPGWLNAQMQYAVTFETDQLAKAAVALTAAVNARGEGINTAHGFDQRMSALELQRDMGMIENTYSANLGVIQALGPTQTILRDPRTGEEMTTQSDFATYCKLSDGTVVGSDSVRYPDWGECAQQLHKVDPHP